MIFKSTTDLPNFYTVGVITIVKAKPPHPVICRCKDETDLCFQIINEDFQVSCSVSNARPAVPIRWKVKTALGEMNISTLVTVSNGSLTQTSRAFTTQIFLYSNILALLVCKSDGQARGLDETDAHVLFVNGRENCSVLKTENNEYFKVGTEIILECGKEGSNYPLIVWSRLHDGFCEYLLYAVSFEEIFVKTIANNYKLGNRGSLVVPYAELQHEGPYFCVFGNGHTDGIVRRDVSVYVNPNPPYPVVEGCNHGQYCILEARREGNLKCSVFGIRPKVHLEWRSLHGHKLSSISFHRPNLTITKKGGTFDVALNTRYRLERRYTNRLTIECIVAGQNANIFNISTKVDLVFETDSMDDYIPDDEEVTNDSKYPRSLPGRRKVEIIHANYSLPINRHIQRSSDTDDIFIAILGRTGVGKSATANCIFGRHVFKEELDSVPITTKTMFQSQTVDDRVVNIVDTPGLDNSNVLEDSSMKEISRIFDFFSVGVDVLVFVSNIADINRVDEDLRALDAVKVMSYSTLHLVHWFSRVWAVTLML
ncbi:Immune-associated nucleotide-binding protein 12 [Holothuria leucospilota]|uniref:Immune-associated nucleotide-binding protein 12 n=1 Tax=Holothuria leucospilota TaxID=206669 RepID=A0A9Q0YJN5_HOLLE|nr:Immune-associated nucleotide-binding protein 12 [Holothuria leucospilota]